MTTMNDNLNGLRLISGRLVILFLTLALAEAVIKNFPAGTRIKVTNDPDPSKNGEYTWDGVKLVKTTNNVLERAREEAEETAKKEVEKVMTADEILGIISGQITGGDLDRRLEEKIERIPSIQGTIEDMKDEVRVIEREVQNRVYDLNIDVQNINSRIDEINIEIDIDLEAVKKLIQDLETRIETDFEAIRDSIAAFEQQIQADFDALQKVVTDFENKIQADFDQLEADIAAKFVEVDKIRTDLDKEVQDRINAVKAETDARVAEIKLLNDGLTKEIAERKDGDQKLLVNIENYKESNDAALSNVRDEIQVAVDASSANAQKISALDARVKTSEENAETALENSAAAVSKAEAAVTQVGALATRVDSVEASVQTAVDQSGTALENSATALTQSKAAVDKSNAVAEQVTVVEAKLNDKSTTYRQPTAPTKANTPNLTKGDIWINTTAGKNYERKRWNGTAWEDITDPRPAANATAISKLTTQVNEQDGRITANANNITSLTTQIADKADAAALNQLQTTVTEQGEDIAANSNAITDLRASVGDKADAKALQDLTATVTQQGEDLTAQGKQITAVEASVTNMDIGGQNLWSVWGKNLSQPLASGNNYIAVEWLDSDEESYRATILREIGNYQHYFQNMMVKDDYPLVVDDEYVVSFEMRASKALKIASILTYNGALGTVLTRNQDVGTEWKTFIIPMKANGTATTGNSQLFGYNLDLSAGWLKDDWYEVRRVQLQKGNKATRFNKASKLLLNELAASSKAIQTVEATVTKQGETIVAQGQRMDALQQEVNGKASSQALDQLKSTVEVQGDAITTNANAITSLKGVVDGKADTSALNALSTTVKSQGDAITAQGQAITSVEAKVNTLNVGARNLQTNGHFLKKNVLNGWANYYGTLTAAGDSLLVKKVTTVSGANRMEKTYPANYFEAGKDYSLTLSAKTPIIFDWRAFVNANIVKIISPTAPSAEKFQKYSVIFRPVNIAVATTIRGYVANLALNQEVIVDWEKLEEGNLPTDWSPAPEDVQDELNATSKAVTDLSATVTQQGNDIVATGQRLDGLKQEIDGKASSQALDQLKSTVATQGDAITANTTAITDLKTSVAGKADAKALTALESTVKAQGEDIEAQSQKIDNVEASLNGMEIGGQNLWSVVDQPVRNESGTVTKTVINADEEHFRCTVNSFTGTAVISRNEDALVDKGLVFKVGDEFMISFEARASKAARVSSFYYYFGSAGNRTNLVDLTTEWQRFEYPFKATGVGTAGTSQMFGVGLSSTSGWAVNDWYEIRNVQVQRGNKATNYAKAPTKLAYEIKANSTATSALQATVVQQGKDITATGQRIDGLKQEVDGKASSQALDQLKSTVTTQGNDISTNTSKITTLEGQIKDKADASALQALDVVVKEQGDKIEANSNAVTKVEARIGAKDSDSLCTDYNLALVDEWESHYPNIPLNQHFKTTTTGKVTNTVFRKDTTNPNNCFVYNRQQLPNDRAYKVSAWVRAAAGTTGVFRATAKYMNAAGQWVASNYSSFVFDKDIVLNGEWQLLTCTIDRRDAPNFTQMKIGFAIGHTGSTGWSELQGFKVARVVDTGDIDSTIATASAVNTLGATVKQNSDAITAQGTAITNLETKIDGKADSSAVNELKSTVTEQGLKIESNSLAVTRVEASVALTATGLSFVGNRDTLRSVPQFAGTPPDEYIKKVSLFAEPTATTGFTIRIGEGGSASGSDAVSGLQNNFIAIDPNKMYRVKYRYRRVSGDGGVYIAIAPRGANRTTNVNTSDSEIPITTIANLIYATTNAKPALGTWVTGEYFLKGKSAGASTGSGTLASPRTFPSKAGFFSVGLLANYGVTTGVQDFDYIIVEDYDAQVIGNANGSAIQSLDTRVKKNADDITSQSQSITKLTNDLNKTNQDVSKKAESSVVQALDSKVSDVEGKVEANTQAITNLNSSVSAVENEVSKKADASVLTNYSTHAETDKAVADGVNAYNVKLKVGTANFAKNTVNGDAWSAGYQGSRVVVTPFQSKDLLKECVNRPFRLAITGGTSILKATPAFNVAKSAEVIVSYKIKNEGDETVSILMNGLNHPETGASQAYIYLKGDRYVRAGEEMEVVIHGRLRPAYESFQLQIQVPNLQYTEAKIIMADVMIAEGNALGTWTYPFEDTAASIEANASAITATKAEVTNIDGVVKAHTSQINSMQSSIDGKADAKALQDLSTTVSQQGSTIASQGQAITSVESKVDNLKLDRVTVPDTRADNQPPNWYWTNYPRSIVTEFKTSTAIGLTTAAMGTYVSLETIVQYSGSSGGAIKQVAQSGDFKNSQYRYSTGTGAAATWTPWRQYIKELDDGIQANSTAITKLDTRTTANENSISTQAQQISGLQSTIAGKADAAALNQLSTKVEQQGNTLTSQGQSITQVEATIKGQQFGGTNLQQGTSKFESFMAANANATISKVSGGFKTDLIRVTKTQAGAGGAYPIPALRKIVARAGTPITMTFKVRGNVEPRYLYLMGASSTGSNLPANSVEFSGTFNATTFITVTAKWTGASFSYQTGVYPYIGNSGGAAGTWFEFAELMIQEGNTATAWSDSFLDIPDIDLSEYAKAAAVNKLTADVQEIDGKVSAQAQMLTQIETTVGGHTSQLQQQGQVIDGLKAEWTVKTDVDGYVSGIGLSSTGTTSEFIVRADRFAIASPKANGNDKQYGFVYQASPVTLPNGTVIPAGLYVNNLMIGEINANRINAQDLSAVSARIGLLRTADTGARTEIRDNLITVFDDVNRPRVMIGVF